MSIQTPYEHDCGHAHDGSTSFLKASRRLLKCGLRLHTDRRPDTSGATDRFCHSRHCSAFNDGTARKYNQFQSRSIPVPPAATGLRGVLPTDSPKITLCSQRGNASSPFQPEPTLPVGYAHDTRRLHDEGQRTPTLMTERSFRHPQFLVEHLMLGS